MKNLFQNVYNKIIPLCVVYNRAVKLPDSSSGPISVPIAWNIIMNNKVFKQRASKVLGIRIVGDIQYWINHDDINKLFSRKNVRFLRLRTYVADCFYKEISERPQVNKKFAEFVYSVFVDGQLLGFDIESFEGGIRYKRNGLIVKEIMFHKE